MVPFIIVAVLFYYTAVTQSFVTTTTPKADTTVSVTAFKWNWKFSYDDRPDPRTNEAVYTVGFVAFWLLGMLSSALTLFLHRPIDETPEWPP